MLSEAVIVDIKFKFAENLLLQELERNLSDDSFQLPNWVFVQLFDILLTFSWRLEFGTKVSLKNGLEERNPWSQLALLEQIWSNNDLNSNHMVSVWRLLSCK